MQGARLRAARNLAEAEFVAPGAASLCEQIRELREQLAAERGDRSKGSAGSVIESLNYHEGTISVVVRGAIRPGDEGMKLSKAVRLARDTVERTLPGAKVKYFIQGRAEAIMELEPELERLCAKEGVHGSMTGYMADLEGEAAAIKRVRAAFTRAIENVNPLLTSDFEWLLKPTNRRPDPPAPALRVQTPTTLGEWAEQMDYERLFFSPIYRPED
jgi:hypothetical protein